MSFCGLFDFFGIYIGIFQKLGADGHYEGLNMTES